MPIADILNLGLGRLTSQQLADFALAEDREHRAALRRQDHATAERHAIERDKFLNLIERN